MPFRFPSAGRPLQFHNTLSGRKEIFEPLAPGEVKMYVCGITPYDESHLGHARCYVFFDTVRRFLRASGFKVTYVQNFTDIDDKIIARAAKSNEPCQRLSERYIADYFRKMEQLHVERPDADPRVTQFLPQIVRFVSRLVESGAAYVKAEGVYFSVRKFSGYGKLSKRALDDLEAGARVEVDETKEDPLDFALWKRAKPGEPSWDSPWGAGRPGWHIECSVMSIHHLGESFDIHGGGQDLIFPHHENEIAQSECATGKPFARYWLHNGFVTLNREKMSKSLGNFFTLGEIFARYRPEVVRLFLLSRHYRTPLDFSDDLLNQSAAAYQGLLEASELCSFVLGGEARGAPETEVLADWAGEFAAALSDDFNTEKALSVLFRLRGKMAEGAMHRDLPWVKQARATLRLLLEEVLGIPLPPILTGESVAALKRDLARRDEFRKAKDWKSADVIRQEFAAKGFAIEDTAQGPLLKVLPPA